MQFISITRLKRRKLIVMTLVKSVASSMGNNNHLKPLFCFTRLKLHPPKVP